MAHPRQEELLAALPAALRDGSVDLSDLGSAEYAFPVGSADQVFQQLAAAGFLILGGDLWRRQGDGFAPAYQDWYTDSPSGSQSSWDRFLRTVSDDDEDLFVTFVVK